MGFRKESRKNMEKVQLARQEDNPEYRESWKSSKDSDSKRKEYLLNAADCLSDNWKLTDGSSIDNFLEDRQELLSGVLRKKRGWNGFKN